MDVLNAGKKYKKTYETLTTRERKRRIQFFTKELLAACVDKDLLRKMGRNYFLENKDLAIASLNLLDGVCNQIQWKLKVNLKDLQNQSMQQNDLEEEPPSQQCVHKTL